MQPSAFNRLGLDYRAEAARLGPPPVPIFDAHIHVNGPAAAAVFREVAALYGVTGVLSQTRLADAESVREVMGDRIRFVAVPNWGSPDRNRAFREGFLEDIPVWRERFGARIVKFWCAPRLWDLLGADGGDPRDAAPVDSPWRVRAAELAQSLGMMFMVHVADPDTWFATKYTDATKYGTKRSHYEALERMLDRFAGPWILAHMGGSPEDLDFLDGLLTRHANAYLDTSATKWQVRELSKHPPERVRAFFERWRGRILFGSDIVTTDEHLTPRAGAAKAHPMGELADSPKAAFGLYASRYWALRTMFETDYDGESPIADPDLAMVEPGRYDEMSAPRLRGLRLSRDLLGALYSEVAAKVVGA